MLKHGRVIIGSILVLCVLGGIWSVGQASDIPSGIIAVFPNSEPVGEPDVGPQGSGSVDNDNSNLTMDFGFYRPTPTPPPLPTPTPDPSQFLAPDATPSPDVTPAPGGTPTPTPTSTPESGDTGGERFGKRRERSGLEEPCVVIPADIEKPWFVTDMAMYAASEMQMTGHPLMQDAEGSGLVVDESSYSRSGSIEFGAEMLGFSVQNINTLTTNSGLGIHLKQAPLLLAAAHAANRSPEEHLKALLANLARQSGLDAVPEGMYPLFLEYAEGDPRRTTTANPDDWTTLHWESQSFNTHIIPSAYGQTLLRQALLIQEFLAANHNQHGVPDPNGKFVGVNDVKGFLGLLNVVEVINKLWFMQQHLLYTPPESQNGMQAPYFPFQTHLEFEDGQYQVQVLDEHSRLFDQASLLWALSEVMRLTADNAPPQIRRVFQSEFLGVAASDPQVSAAAVHEWAAHLADSVFITLSQAHYSDELHTLLDMVPLDEDQPAAMSTTYLGLSLTALERYHQAITQPARQQRIVTLMTTIADFLLQSAYDREHDEGGVFETMRIDPESPSSDLQRSNKTLEAQMSGIRGLLAAYALTRNTAYRNAAFALFNYAEKALWDHGVNVYARREKGGEGYTYTPMSVGSVVGALRELILVTDDPALRVHLLTRMKTFTRAIAKHAGLQLSEVITRAGQEFLVPVSEEAPIRTAQSLNSPFGLAPVLGDKISLNEEAINALHSKRPTDSCAQARNAFRSAYYYTDIGMYAASELVLLGRDVVEGRAARQAERDKADAATQHLALLEPMLLDDTGAKAMDYADRHFTHIQLKSSLGVHLKYGPVFRAEAEKQGLSVGDYVGVLLRRYMDLTGYGNDEGPTHLPKYLLPIFLEFEGGIPEVPGGQGFQEWSDMDASLVPSALGQSLLRQSLWLRQAMSTRHDDQDEPTPNGRYLGRSSKEGFVSLLVAQAIANKLVFLRDAMLVPLEFGATPSGRYIPHRFEVDASGDRLTVQIKDADSVLFDQVSLLWGLSEFYQVSDPRSSDIFGDSKVLSAEYHELAAELAAIMLNNLEALHWDERFQTFYDLRDDEPEGAPERVISTDKAAFAIMALESVVNNFTDRQALRDRARHLLMRQIEFLTTHLYRPQDGAISNGARLGDEVEALRGMKTLLAQVAALRSFLIAFHVTGDASYLRQADQTFEFLDATFWDKKMEVYKSAIGGSQYHYTALNAGMTVGALRELLAVRRGHYFGSISERLAKFFQHVIERVGLQLPEETVVGGHEKALAPILASDLIVQPIGSSVDRDVPQPGSILTYTISFTEETLACAASDGYVEDILPEGVVFVSSIPLPELIDGQIIRWNVGDLVPDEDGVYTIYLEVRVDPVVWRGFEYADLLNGRQTWRMNNCATLFCRSTGEAEQDIYSDCTETEIKLPQLGLEKSLRSVLLEPGQDAEFEIVVTNLSEVTAYTVTIEDHLPEGLTYVPESVRTNDAISIELDDQEPLVWVLDDLEPDESMRFTYKATLDPNLEIGLYMSRVKAYAMDRSGFEFETNEFEFTFTVEEMMAFTLDQHLTDGQQEIREIAAGPPVTLSTVIRNVGSAELRDARLLITLPEGIDYRPQSSRLDGGQLAEPNQEKRTLSWPIGNFAPGLKRTFICTLQAQSGSAETLAITTRIQGTKVNGEPYQGKEQTLDVTLAPYSDPK